MFSSALKTFNSNILSNYTIAPQPSTLAGPWKVFDAKRKQSGKPASVFVFEKKSLDPSSSSSNGGFGSSRNSGGMSVKRAQEEVIERLKKEASSLARLRHPSILELMEPVEETAKGGLMFATEPVTASLAELLREKDDQERAGGVRGRGSRYVVEEADGTRRRRELEIDELEIQKGLLQLAKGLEFLHGTGGLVHANLTPEAVLINAKGDWKISGLAFCGPHESSTAATSLVAISLHEALNHDPRLPRSVQLDLDCTSPDFVLDNTLTASGDMFSLGLLIIALYNSPHSSPIKTGGSLSSYKRVFSSSSTIPTRTNNFLVPSSHPLPSKLVSDLLPRLITRRAAQRLSAKEFQEASYFDNILVSTIRFLEEFPAKSANEKAQFMKGLPRIMSQFPKSVLEKKVLPVLLEEMKDRDLVAPIMTNVFAMVKVISTGQKVFPAVVVPHLKEVFVTNKGTEKDTSREAGLMVLLENMPTAVENCQGREFREDILPIILTALESPTHTLVDAALRTLPELLKVLDFSTIKNELFPVISGVFAKTSSLNIKIRGLESFYILCGGTLTADGGRDDDLYGLGEAEKKKAAGKGSVILDKYTVQEKIVPLLKGIKTKEPAVMMAALRVIKQVGEVADTDFVAIEVLPILWHMSLGPLLNLQQFQAFITLIKDIGTRIEREQTKKLKELAGSNSQSTTVGARSGASNSNNLNGLSNGEETDFETLVSGRKTAVNGPDDLMSEWGVSSDGQASSSAPAFAWQSQPIAAQPQIDSRPGNTLRPQQQPGGVRTITPDQTLSTFATLQPSATQYSQPLQPAARTTSTPSVASTATLPMRSNMANSTNMAGTGIDWSAASKPQQTVGLTGAFGATSKTTMGSGSGFSIPPPPMSPPAQPGQHRPMGSQSAIPPSQQQLKPQQHQFGMQANANQQRSGLDKYESLI